jgi:hypothetical protein
MINDFTHYETVRVFYGIFDGMVPEDLGVDSTELSSGRLTESDFIDILLQYAIEIVEEETTGWSKGIMMDFLGSADFTEIATHFINDINV